MTSTTIGKAEIDRLARLFTTALFDLHEEETAPTTQARLASLILEETSSRALSLALAKASLGFSIFGDLLQLLIQTLKSTLENERIKHLQVECGEQGPQSFTAQVQGAFEEELKDQFRSGATTFPLRDGDGSLNTFNPCLNAAFFSAVALKLGLTSIGKYHVTVALEALGLTENKAAEDRGGQRAEAYAIATLIMFSVGGVEKYARILAEAGVEYEEVPKRLRGLKNRGVLTRDKELALLETVAEDFDRNASSGRSDAYVRGLLFSNGKVV
ncbi:hypothetical protein CC2G_002675 [Coprinopsis cinerea AmutBmut pab1-1]|nr:hypothetical protein CC2G_002675 [Coprinopsis cinerea AmutBmut pab1-1]